MSQVFTQDRSQLRTGLVCLAFFVVMLVFSVMGMYEDAPADRRIYGMLCFGIAWSFMAGLAGWSVLDYFRSFLTLAGDEVGLTGVLTRRTILLSEVVRACWRVPHLSLKLYLPKGSTRIWLCSFSEHDRKQLARYFRQAIRPEVQEGWNDAPERFANEEPKDAAEEVRKLFKSLRKAALVGPLAGLACRLCLHFYAGWLQVQAVPVWTGSVLLDWLLIGSAIGLLMLVSMRALVWMGGGVS